MKRSVPVVILVFIIAILMLFVSDYKFKPLDTLMKPPKVEGENLAIQLAFEESVGGEYRLITPIKGENHAAYTFFDLDSNKQDEVIVFYSKISDVDLVRMNVLSCDEDGRWKSIADFESSYSEVQQVEFADLNGDKFNEIIVGWGVYNNDLTKKMNVYMISGTDGETSFENIFSDTYYDFKTADIDRNGTTDILKISYDSVLDRLEYKISLITDDGENIVEKSEISLDGSLSSVTNITFDYDESKNRTRLYVDGLKYESGMVTDCVFWDNSNSEFIRENRMYPPLGAVSSRSTNVKCFDINEDGIIEIPTEEELPGSEIITAAGDTVKKQPVIKWMQIDKSIREHVERTILNLNYGYGVKINDNLLKNFTVVNNQTNGMLTFYKIDYSTGEAQKGEALFSIKVIKADETDTFLSYKYKYIDKNKNFYYYCRIYSGGENINITKKDISGMIFFDYS